MKVKELIKKLKEYDWEEEIKLRVWYVKWKADVLFDFKVDEDTRSDEDNPFVRIQSKVDIDDFLTDKHGCIEYRNY